VCQKENCPLSCGRFLEGSNEEKAMTRAQGRKKGMDLFSILGSSSPPVFNASANLSVDLFLKEKGTGNAPNP